MQLIAFWPALGIVLLTSGLTLLTKTLALEWARDGINVNALCPGPFATEINTPLLSDPAARAQMEANVPLARWGDPVELGPAAVFLASEASSFMTGATVWAWIGAATALLGAATIALSLRLRLRR